MSRLFAILFVVILFGAIFYVYDMNASDPGVKIEKLKLKYTIGDNASPDKILSFSEDLYNLSRDSQDLEKMRYEFESSLWEATGIAKDIAGELNTGYNFADNCLDDSKEMLIRLTKAKQSLENAKALFDNVSSEYTNIEIQDLEYRFSNVEYSINVSSDILFIYCPE